MARGFAARTKEEPTGKPEAFRTSGGEAANCLGSTGIFETTTCRLLERHSLGYLAGAITDTADRMSALQL
jgi:hypothetical protein